MAGLGELNIFYMKIRRDELTLYSPLSSSVCLMEVVVGLLARVLCRALWYYPLQYSLMLVYQNNCSQGI